MLHKGGMHEISMGGPKYVLFVQSYIMPDVFINAFLAGYRLIDNCKYSCFEWYESVNTAISLNNAPSETDLKLHLSL